MDIFTALIVLIFAAGFYLVQSELRRLREAVEPARAGDLAARERAALLLEARARAELERVAGLTHEAARAEIIAAAEREAAEEQSRRIERLLERTRREADARAREVLLTALQRIAADHYQEVTLTTVALPSDKLKERLVGREGRALRTFQEATGVDLLVDDTPGVVILASFDPARREVARRALEKLLQDERIHPARIKEAVAHARRELDALVEEAGRAAARDARVDPLAPELVSALGRLQLRTTHGQNALRHSLEVAAAAGALAEELGLDAALARRAGLLHDVGRAVPADGAGGAHAAAGADLARRAGEREEVVNAIAAHHQGVPAATPYAVLVEVANEICVDRPGPRAELYERYARRLAKLEDAARSFPGVESAFAVLAGRELRVIVNAEKVNDKALAKLARDIARKLEEETVYAGEVRVTVVRESRAVEYAK